MPASRHRPVPFKGHEPLPIPCRVEDSPARRGPSDKEPDVNPLTKLFVAAVIALGGATLATFAPREYPAPLLALTWMAAMGVVSLFKLRLPLRRGNATMSMAYVVDFLVLVTAGPGLAMVIAAGGVLVQCTARVRRPQRWYRTAFSMASVVLATQAAGVIWNGMGGTLVNPGLLTTAVPLVMAALCYFIVNTGLVAIAIELASVEPEGASSWPRFARTAPVSLIGAAAAIVMHLLVTHEAYLFVPSAVTPLLVCYFSYAAWFRRLERDWAGHPS